MRPPQGPGDVGPIPIILHRLKELRSKPPRAAEAEELRIVMACLADALERDAGLVGSDELVALAQRLKSFGSALERGQPHEVLAEWDAARAARSGQGSTTTAMQERVQETVAGTSLLFQSAGLTKTEARERTAALTEKAAMTVGAKRVEQLERDLERRGAAAGWKAMGRKNRWTVAQVEAQAVVALERAGKPVSHWTEVPTPIAPPRPIEQVAPFALARPPRPNRATRRAMAK